jgi:hypothetical protein
MKIKLFFGLILASTIALTQIPTNGLIGYYPFDGNANDISSNTNHGTVVGASLDTGYLGNSNSCYNFSQGSIDLASQIILPDSNLTLTSWVKTDMPIDSVYYKIYSLSKDITFQNADFDFYLQPYYYHDFPFTADWFLHPNCQIIKSNTDEHKTTIPHDWSYYSMIQPKKWHFLVYQITGDSISFYVDNELMYTDTSHSSLMSGATYNSGVIGKDFKGSIDELRIYNRTLTSQELTAIHTGVPTNIDNVVLSEAEVQVYPNPCVDYMTVDFKSFANLGNHSVVVINVHGIEVYNQPVNSTAEIIDASSWSAGLYFLRVMKGNSTVDIKKILVNN